MAGKRVKISFNSVTEGKTTIISKSDVAASNQRIKEAMKDVMRGFEKKEAQSKRDAAKLVLNA